ncbi:histone deacetylase [Chlamydiota bacterium]
MKILYSPDYCADIGKHVFPIEKYKKIYKQLVNNYPEIADCIISPRKALDKEVALVHTQDYIKKLKKGTLSPDDILRLELPYSKELVDASWGSAGGTILACRYALSEEIAISIGGGFHHAYPDHGEGFCVLNDIAIGIRCVLEEALIKKALIIDCDVHQGNGTAAVFAQDSHVFTFSIHQYNNYPAIKTPSTFDINLPDGTTDEEYLLQLKSSLPRIIEEHKPELIIYVAGADPYKNDQLGGLSLSMQGLEQRDEYIFTLAKKHNIAIAVVLAGGYAYAVADTVTIHVNMIKKAIEAFFLNKL